MSQQRSRKFVECNRCKMAGFPNRKISFEKLGDDPTTGKPKWKLLDEDGQEHQHKGPQFITSGKKNFSSSRISEVLYQGGRVEDVNKLLKADKNNQLFAVVPGFAESPVIYVVVKKEAVQ